ncbi:MAG: hypothetical protein ACRBBK_06655 [Paracoccaceae bacterium]
MIAKLLLQKRRILLGIIAGTVALEFLFGATPAFIDITFIVRVLIFALLSTVLTNGYILVAHKYLPHGEKLIETMVLPSIAGAFVLRYTPFGAYLLSHPVAFVAVGLGGIALSYSLLYGNLLDPLTRMDSPVSSAQFQINAPAELLWRMLIPAPGHEKDFAFAGTQFLSEPNSPQNEWLSIFSKGSTTPALAKITRIRLQEIEPGYYFRFGFEPVDSNKSVHHHGWYAITITPQGDGIHTVKIEARALQMPLSVSLDPMLSNHFESHISEAIAAIEARLRREAKRAGITTAPAKAQARTAATYQKPKGPPQKPKRSLTV